jgi:hypothetical protein
MWTRTPESPAAATEAITIEPDLCADGLTAKTLSAADIIATNNTWTEKEVRFSASLY